MSELSRKIVIAVDGTAASGKGTLAKGLATSLGYAYLDTGAIYRMIALDVLKRGGDPKKLDDVHLSLGIVKSCPLPPEAFANPALRTPAIEDATPFLAAMPEVQAAVRVYQHAFAANPPNNAPGVVMDGRDVGTSVFPDAEVKFYVTASAEERARRRFADQKNSNPGLTYEDVLEDINLRDYRDMNRVSSPLRPAKDAVILDTTKDVPAQTLERAVAIVQEKL